jgi:diadenosine tetraphosphate (Ap4A) HIT family hydrolase
VFGDLGCVGENRANGLEHNRTALLDSGVPELLNDAIGPSVEHVHFHHIADWSIRRTWDDHQIQNGAIGLEHVDKALGRVLGTHGSQMNHLAVPSTQRTRM